MGKAGKNQPGSPQADALRRKAERQLRSSKPTQGMPDADVRAFIQEQANQAATHERTQEKLEWLARFPGENPDPVLCVGRDGTILYSNQAGSPLLAAWGCREGAAVSGRWHQCVLDALGSGRTEQAECDCGRQVFALTLAPMPESGYVNVYASDVTERKRAEDALRNSEGRYRSLFKNMLNGYAYCRMLFDQGRPQDFIYLDVNNAFESMTGLRNVVGKRVSEVIPGICESDPELIEIYGRVATTGVPERFEAYVRALGMWFAVSVYSPGKEHFVAMFDVITERKAHEREIERLNRLYSALGVLNQTIVGVKSREELFREVCRIVAEKAGFKVVWVGLADPKTHAVNPVARAGDDEGYLDEIEVYADDRPEGRGPVGTCIREGKTCVFNNFFNDPLAAPWHAAAAAHGIQAVSTERSAAR